MRTLGLALCASLLAASTPLVASAQPSRLGPVSDVDVRIGPELQEKAQKYGQDDVNMLARELKSDVERELRKAGRLGPGGARLELTILDAKPDHPTRKMMDDQPGLDYIRSTEKGGAEISGVEIQPNGARRSVHFENFNWWLRQAHAQSTWGDAENTFSWFARDYARGKQ